MQVTCGIDWAEDHHDVAVVDPEARLPRKLRVSDDAAGFQDLLRLLAEHGDTPDEPIPIETSRGQKRSPTSARGFWRERLARSWRSRPHKPRRPTSPAASSGPPSRTLGRHRRIKNSRLAATGRLALTPEHYGACRDPDHQDPDELRDLLGQPADGHLDARPVSTAVNNVRNNGPQLLDRAVS